jgi:rubrerythrin
MSLITSLVERCRGSTRIYECRHCGTTLGDSEDACSACGAHSVAVYDV